jgi:TRAP transporter TAXI family solute receptor
MVGVRFLGLLCWLAAFAGEAFVGAALAQTYPPPVLRSRAEYNTINANRVGLVTGSPGGVYATMGDDLRNLLDDRDKSTLRVFVLITSGSVANLDDLQNLKGVSFAIVQSDVIEAYAAEPTQLEWLKSNIRYVTALHTEALHIVTRKEIVAAQGGDSSLCALAGRTINVGGLRSGSMITAHKVLNDVLRLNVQFVDGSTKKGLEQLAAKQVDAVAFVVGAPAPVFAKADETNRFLDNDFVWLSSSRALLERGCPGRPTSGDRSVYQDEELTPKDYPYLIPLGQSVPVIGVPAILAAFKFGPNNADRVESTSKFISAFFTKAPDRATGLGVANGGFSPNWCGVDFKKKIDQLERHEAAAKWLAENKTMPTKIECGARARPDFCSNDIKLAQEVLRRNPATTSAELPKTAENLKNKECL